MVIFGTGVVTGGLLVSQARHPFKPERLPGPGLTKQTFQPGSPGGTRVDLLRRVSRELDLTPEQHERVDKILKESQERTRKVMSPFLREELQRTTSQFREVLTTNQQVRFDELLKQKRAREPKHGPGPADRPVTPTVVTNN